MGGEIIYPELSYKIVGIAFNLHSKFGYNHREKHIQNAFEVELKQSGLEYKREKCIELYHNNVRIGKYFLDFIVDDKIIVELKVVPEFQGVHIRQVLMWVPQI